MKKIVPTLEEVMALHKSGDLAAAKKGYQQRLAGGEESADLHDLLGLLNAEEVDLGAAEYHFKRANELDASKAVFLLHLSNVYKANGQYDLAKSSLQTALEIDPEYAAVYNNLGAIAAAEQEWLLAIKHYQRAIDLQANYADAYFNLGLACRKASNWVLAEGAFKALLDLSNDHPGANFQLGLLYMLQEKYALAIDHFLKIIAAFPHHIESQVNLATCYLKSHQLENALHHYQAAYAIDANEPQVLFNLGVIAMQYHQLPAAIEYFQALVAIDAHHYAAHNNLGVLYLYRQDKMNAIKHYQYCLHLQPHNIAIQHTLHILRENKVLTNSPPEYIEALFDSYADHYDAHLVTGLHYQVPQQLFKLLQRQQVLTYSPLSILDLGCGTGLSAEVFKPMVGKLKEFVGVDISEKMLAIAAQKRIYSKLVKQEIVEYLTTETNMYDLIISADVLVYFGALNDIFTAAQRRLVLGGFFTFNTEIHLQHDYILQASGRFAHRADYIQGLIATAGFALRAQEEVSLRSQNGIEVRGNLFLIEKIKDV